MDAEQTKSFYQKVYKIVQQIPMGKVTTYGAIAACLGIKGSARMVGWALNQIKNIDHIPAHRVVNRQGLLTGKLHFMKPTTMEERLQKEGVMIKNNQVNQLADFFWDPAISFIAFR